MQGWIRLTPVPCALPGEGRVKGKAFIYHVFLLSFPIKLYISAQGSFSLF